MRILTVRQPWAWAIIHGGKDVENRVRNIAGDYRGPVAIHAGLASALDWNDDGGAGDQIARLAGFWPGIVQCPTGAIIGVVDMADVHRGISEDGSEICYCSPWAQIENWHLALTNPRPLSKSLTHWADGTPIKGALGLRNLTAEQERWVLDHAEVTS